jgi:DNA helicase HerA-like ATPase
MTRDAELHYVVGPRGSGKTTTMKAVVAHLMRERDRSRVPWRMVIFDPAHGKPSDEWFPRGAVYVRTRREYLLALASPARIVVVKGALFAEWAPLNKMKRLIVVVDEAHRYMRRKKADPAFVELVSEGRHRDIDLVIGTQLFSQLHETVVGNPTAAWAHELLDAASRDWLRDSFGISARHLRWERVPGTEHATYPLRFPDAARVPADSTPTTVTPRRKREG